MPSSSSMFGTYDSRLRPPIELPRTTPSANIEYAIRRCFQQFRQHAFKGRLNRLRRGRLLWPHRGKRRGYCRDCLLRVKTQNTCQSAMPWYLWGADYSFSPILMPILSKNKRAPHWVHGFRANTAIYLLGALGAAVFTAKCWRFECS